MSTKTKILIAEHDSVDVELLERELKRGGINYVSEIVQNEQGFINALTSFIPDIILADYTFPSFNGPAAFEIREKIAPATPFIFVSGTIGEEKSIELIKNGVTDYALKDKLFSLPVKVKRALKEAKERQEKNKTEKELILSQARLVEAQAVSKVGSWEFDLLSMDLVWSREIYRIFEIDPDNFPTSYPAFLELTHPDDRIRVDTVFTGSFHSHSVNSIEHRIVTAGGDIKIVDERWRIFFNGQGQPLRAVGTCQDITERKKADNKIKESELRYRSLNEQATDAICITDANWKFIEINPYGCEILGYTRDEVLQLSLPDIFFAEDIEGNPLKVAELQLGKTVRNERRLKRKDGTAVDMEVSAKIMEEGRMIMFGHDITERKKAEEKLRKANRLVAFISQVNQNIVHLKDEAELFRNSCQIAFEFGKFKIAWIGVLNKETEKITLIDQSGIADKDIPLFTDTTYQNGPQNHVLSTDTYYLCNDIDHDPELQSWKPFAAKHGIQSAIVLPVKKSGQIIGTFNLYAAELNFFDREEIALLTDVTEDISFALDMLEKDKKQKKTEELILKNEKRFRALIEESPDIKTLTSPDGKIFYVSPSITKFLGYQVDEFLVKSVFELIHPDDRMSEKIIQELFTTPGKSFQLQQRMLHKNGHWVSFEGIIANLLHEPAINALVSNFRDISEKKITEQQREFDSVNLNALINNTSDLMWSVGQDCKLITFNQPFFDIIRLVTGKELAKGDDVFSVVLSPEQHDRLKISYARALSGEAFTEVEHIASPVEFWSEISYYPIRQGTEIIGTACHSRDITERKKTADKNRFQAELLETIGQAVMAADINGNINFWNNAAQEIYGWTSEEAVGQNVLQLIPSQQTKEQAAEIMEKLYQGHSWSGELVMQRKDGTDLTVSLTDSPVYDQHHKLIGIIGVSFDISERKLAEIRVNELNESLQKHVKELAVSNAELEQFAYVASHDLQEPLRMITSFLSQLEKKYGDIIDEKGKTYIAFAIDGAKRMRQIILDLLEFSRVGRTEDSQEELDLNELVKEIQILFQKQVEEKKAVMCSDELPVIKAYKAQLRQVFQNLVSNALKYTRENIPCKIQITVTELKTHWQFAVADNGIGIDSEYFDKIFIIFQRLHNKDEFSGTGMGLAVTKKIIENLEGKIWVESEEGKGSTFYFTIKK